MPGRKAWRVPWQLMRIVNAVLDALTWCVRMVFRTYLSFWGVEIDRRQDRTSERKR
jgi:hypothetical protein